MNANGIAVGPPETGSPDLESWPLSLVANGIVTQDPSVGSPKLILNQTPSERFTAGILSRYDCDNAIVLLEIEHASLNETIRANNSGEDIYHNSLWYVSYPFSIELPDDTEEEPSGVISIANVDRQIGSAIDSLTSTPTLRLKVVSSFDPEEVHMDWIGFRLGSFSRNAMEVSGTFSVRQYSSEPFPNIVVRKSNFQNLFKA
jgi:hypothetical protein